MVFLENTGKRADLVILDRNPLKVDKMEIRDIQVLETIKDGETILKIYWKYNLL